MAGTNVGGLYGDTRAPRTSEISGDGCTKLVAKASVGYNSRVDKLDLAGSAAFLQHLKDLGITYYVMVDGSYNSLKGDTYNEAGSAKLRLDYNFWKPSEETTLGVVTMATGMHSKLMGLDWRVTGGGGPQFIFENGGFLLDASLFVLGEGEKVADGPDGAAARLSARLYAEYKFGASAGLGMDVISASNLGDLSDNRTTAEFFVQGQIYGPVSLGLSVFHEIDTAPIPGIDSQATYVQSYLSVEWDIGIKKEEDKKG